MNKNLFLSLLFAIILVFNLSAQVQHFTWQGTEREYLVRIPTGHEGPLPVLFFLHGLNTQIVPFDQEFNFSQMAEDFGWAIVVPQALNLGIGTMWSAGLIQSSVDDAGFLMALLDSLTVQYQLDTDSVFFTGFSMGGFMTHRMAIEYGDRITACAPVSGLITNTMAAQTPVAPVRMLHIHGTSDNVVGYSGYSSVFGTSLGLGVTSILDYWQNANGCSGEPVIDTFPDLHNDGLRFICYTYNCGTDLQLLKVENGTHTWYQNPNQYDVGYNDIIYAFFTGHSFLSSIPEHTEGQLQVWPNPTSGILNIQAADSQTPFTTVTLFDVFGRMMDQIEATKDPTSQQSIQIDLSCYPDGVYFVQEGNGAVTKVVLKR